MMRWLGLLVCAGSFAAVGLGAPGTAGGEGPHPPATPAPAPAPEPVKLECRAQGAGGGSPILSFEVVLRPIPERPGHYRLELDTGLLAAAVPAVPAVPAPPAQPPPPTPEARLPPPRDLQPVVL